MFSLLPSLKSQYFDNNGNPLSGGKLYSYIAGSSTPVDTFTDATGQSINSNPIILDARGEADIWISSSIVYKFVLTDSNDVEIYSVDNVRSQGGSGGGSSTDELVKVSVADTIAGYLVDKLVGSDKIQLSTLNAGGIEQLKIELVNLLASDISNDSNVSGINVRDALNTLLDGLNNIAFPVTSVNGEVGAVVLGSSDISNQSSVTGLSITDALNDLQNQITSLPSSPVDSVFGRVGAVVAQASDYDASQVDNDSGVSGAFVSDALDNLQTQITSLPSTQNVGNSTIWTYKGYDNTRNDPFFGLNPGEFILWQPSGNSPNNIFLIINSMGLDNINYSLAFNDITNSSVFSVQDSTNNDYKFSQDLSMGSPLGNGDYFFGWWMNGTLYDSLTQNVAIDTPCVLNFDVRREAPAPPTPGGSDTQIQYNDNGIFNGIPSLSYEVNNSTPNGTTPVYARYPFVWNRTIMVDDEISLLDALEWISVDTILIGAGAFVQNNNIAINNGDKSIEILGNNYLDLAFSINFFGVNSLRIYGLVTFNLITNNQINLDSDVYIKELGGLEPTINFIGTGTLYYESFNGGNAPAGWTGNIVKQHWSNIRPAPSSDANNGFSYGSDGLPYVDNTASQITNDSVVSGAFVDDALNTIQSDINSINTNITGLQNNKLDDVTAGDGISLDKSNPLDPVINVIGYKISGSIGSTGSLTIDADTYNQYSVTALATSPLNINAPTGTLVDGQKLIIRIKDDGVGHAVNWNVIFNEVGVTLPVTTTANKVIYAGCIYNSSSSKWDVVALAEEA